MSVKPFPNLAVSIVSMIQTYLVKLLLAPVSLLYGAGVSLRNFFYKTGLLKSLSFSIPVISVGNLSVGGAGKTPHIEYLIRLLRAHVYIATLSRGYKRKTRGFIEVQKNMTAEQVGDEPLQFKKKFPDITVAVAENRAFAIPNLKMRNPNTEVILLDDAFQHRSVKPGKNILLTEYDHPFTKDYLLPSGRLREWRSAYQRADIIIVSKCPANITEADRTAFRQEINPLPHQQLFFSYYKYYQPQYIINPAYSTNLQTDWDVLLVSAIARTDYLMSYLEPLVNSIHSMEYEDHHPFTAYDLSQIKQKFDQMDSEKKLILTTEKDAVRLLLHQDFIINNRLPIFAVPVQVQFHFEEGAAFDEEIKKFLLDFKV